VDIKTQVLEDGITVQYRIEDKEQVNNIILPGVAKVEAVFSKNQHYLGAEKGAYLVTQASFKAWEEYTKIMAIAVGAVGMGWAQAHKLAWAARTAKDIARALLPLCGYSFNVKVWGTQAARRPVLERAVLNCINTTIPLVIQNAAGYDQQITHDVMGRYVEGHITVLLGPTAAIVDLLGLINLLPADDHLPVFTQAGPLVGPLPPRDNGTRGNNIRDIVANSLADTGPAPPAPALPPNVNPGTP
jgi:hypothetical protein